MMTAELLKDVRDARIALSFYRQWIERILPGNSYPSGIAVEMRMGDIYSKAIKETEQFQRHCIATTGKQWHDLPDDGQAQDYVMTEWERRS